jgi:hypothetical protein
LCGSSFEYFGPWSKQEPHQSTKRVCRVMGVSKQTVHGRRHVEFFPTYLVECRCCAVQGTITQHCRTRQICIYCLSAENYLDL